MFPFLLTKLDHSNRRETKRLSQSVIQPDRADANTHKHTHLSPHNTHSVLYALPALRERESSASHLISPTSALSHPELCFQLHLRREIRKNESVSHTYTPCLCPLFPLTEQSGEVKLTCLTL